MRIGLWCAEFLSWTVKFVLLLYLFICCHGRAVGLWDLSFTLRSNLRPQFLYLHRNMLYSYVNMYKNISHKIVFAFNSGSHGNATVLLHV